MKFFARSFIVFGFISFLNSSLAYSNSDVEDYHKLYDQTIKLGRSAADLAISNNYRELFKLFSLTLVKAMPYETLEVTLKKYDKEGFFEAYREENAWLGSGAQRFYVSRHAIKKKDYIFIIGFNEDDEISSFVIKNALKIKADSNKTGLSSVVYHLPFSGTFWTMWGGETELNNYHVKFPFQRYAYDFTIWKAGTTYQTTGTQNEDYYAWGQAVLAPAEGSVIEVENRISDNTPKLSIENQEHPIGNYVSIKFKDNRYGFLTHLKKGSVSVKPGQWVKQGQKIGECGNSGNSVEPHIHIHLQDDGTFQKVPKAKGLPLRFSNYLSNGKIMGFGTPLHGEFVKNR